MRAVADQGEIPITRRAFNSDESGLGHQGGRPADELLQAYQCIANRRIFYHREIVCLRKHRLELFFEHREQLGLLVVGFEYDRWRHAMLKPG